MKPICVHCQRFFTCKKNDFPFIEAMQVGDATEALPGNATPEKWEPYKLWLGDRWECEGCGASIVVGVGRQPLSEHYQPDFDELIRMNDPRLQVNDC